MTSLGVTPRMFSYKRAEDQVRNVMPQQLLHSARNLAMVQKQEAKELLTLTKLAGNQASLSSFLPHHQSLLEASRTLMTSPALKPSS